MKYDIEIKYHPSKIYYNADIGLLLKFNITQCLGIIHIICQSNNHRKILQSTQTEDL